MTAVDSIEILKNELPFLFKDWKIPELWEENYEIIPISDPNNIPFEEESDVPFNKSPNLEFSNFPDDIYLDDIYLDYENHPEPFYANEHQIIDAINSLDLYDLFDDAKHPGSLIKTNLQQPGIPPDSMAFYLPFHYYYPNWWGVYLLSEGIELFAFRLIRYCKENISFPEARRFARFYLYHHEAFHHKTECFATRLETSHREPFFRRGFEYFYQKTFLTSDCLEEGLAEATSLSSLKVQLEKNRDMRAYEIIRTLDNLCSKMPPGYNLGPIIRGSDFNAYRAIFSEKNIQTCLPKIPAIDPKAWRVSTHMFDPIANIKSRVNYIIPRSSPIISRISGIRSRITSRVLKKKLKKMVGLKPLNERKGRHPIYETKDGIRIPIPEHPGDLKTGLISGILSQVGLNISVREFQALK